MAQLHAPSDISARREAARQGAQTLAGFSRSALVSYLGSSPAPTNASLTRIYEVLALGKDVAAIPPDQPGALACLVHGPRHFLVKGRGDVGSFTEEAERLFFFPKPPYAPLATLKCEGQARHRGSDASFAPRSVCLQRQVGYLYTIDGQQACLDASDWERVRLLAGSSEVLIPASSFWELAMDAANLPLDEQFRLQIGIYHAARLLGRAPLTIKRHLDRGLPAAGPSRQQPGFTRSAIEEFAAYAERFPQGLPSPRQVQRWQAWQLEWRVDYRQRLGLLLGGKR